MTSKYLLLPIIMKEKFIVLKKDFMCFLFVWILSIRCVSSPNQCPTVISNGALSAGCKAVIGSICSFSCEAGYMRNTSVYELTCKTSRQWSSDPRSLCLKIICPKVFEGGSIADSCSREYRSMCFQYKCDPGYVASVSYLTCGESGRWVYPNGESLKCTRKDLGEEKLGYKVCPDRFNGGYVSWYCNRKPRQTCAYKCNTGYLVNTTITQLTCKENGLWDADTNSLCIESGESTSSPFLVPTSTGGGCEVLALGISLGIGIPMIIIIIIIGCVRWCRLRKARRVPGQADSRYFRSREHPGQHDTNTRQYPASNSVDGVSSFEFATYDRHQISTISSSLKYPEPPPLYSEIQITPNESPPAYKEVVKDPSRFSLDIELDMFNGQR